MMVAIPPTVNAILFNNNAFTRLSDAQPQSTRPIVLVMPIIDKIKAHFSGEQPVCVVYVRCFLGWVCVCNQLEK